MRFTLLHGAKKNAGDYLIRQRAKQLLLEYTDIDGSQLLEVKAVRKELPQSTISEIERTDAVVIAGGPAYNDNFHEVYPSLNRILDAALPVYPLGPGWKGTDESTYQFDSPALSLLEKIHDRIEFSGVRDLPTKRVLSNHGITNVELVGCPAWYDLDHLNDEFTKPSSIDSIVISTAVPRSRYYRKQFRYLLKRFSEEYDDADLYCSFHRGIQWDDHTSFIRSLHLKRFRRTANHHGYTVINPAYQPEKLEQYREFDLHVGYRVHGHIYFLAMRQPSYLLQVDGRGTGVSESLCTPGDVAAFGADSYQEPVEKVLQNIEEDQQNGFNGFDDVAAAIDERHDLMLELIDTLPPES